MRRLVVSEFLTLDGVMQAPGEPDEDRSDGFQHGGWQLAYFDDAFGDFVMQGFAESDAFLFGRRTYETFAAFWPTQPPDHPVAGPMNATQKYVVSTSLAEPLPWENSTLIGTNVADEVRRLKAGEGRDIQVIGSGELVQTLIREGLVDEYRLIIHPLVLGTGKRLSREIDLQQARADRIAADDEGRPADAIPPRCDLIRDPGFSTTGRSSGRLVLSGTGPRLRPGRTLISASQSSRRILAAH